MFRSQGAEGGQHGMAGAISWHGAGGPAGVRRIASVSVRTSLFRMVSRGSKRQYSTAYRAEQILRHLPAPLIRLVLPVGFMNPRNFAHTRG